MNKNLNKDSTYNDTEKAIDATEAKWKQEKKI